MVAKRNYKKEYKNYHSKPEQRKARSSRVMARRKMAKAGLVKKGDGKDVHHVNGNALDKNGATKVVKASQNRSYPRKRNAGKRNSRS